MTDREQAVYEASLGTLDPEEMAARLWCFRRLGIGPEPDQIPYRLPFFYRPSLCSSYRDLKAGIERQWADFGLAVVLLYRRTGGPVEGAYLVDVGQCRWLEDGDWEITHSGGTIGPLTVRPDELVFLHREKP